jgi:hypothetical protein
MVEVVEDKAVDREDRVSKGEVNKVRIEVVATGDRCYKVTECEWLEQG